MSKIIKTKTSQNLKFDIQKIIKPLIGEITDLIKPNDKVLLKPNFNTADPFPASTDMNFLQAMIEIIQSAKPKEIIIGESCTYFLNTEKVCREKGTPELMEKFNITWHNFDQNDWVKVKVPGGKYFKSVSIPKITQEVDKIILLPCLKTHRFAKFTMSLKITIGMLKPILRGPLHLSNLEPRIAEVASVIQPDLIIMDGRKCFVTQGPEEGQIETPNILMATQNDRIALDVEALKILQSYKADNILGNDPWALDQIKRAVELNLGAKSEADYKIIEV
ncbi:MAG: DUF362 domain-containing protein [Candidatus Buchananbacteria bacterium]|nr:DUF362 domain-containing protein [Candidatus Buchananbacteria bacterium]